MTREPAQAGNRASRTEHYLQWRENSPEWEAAASAVEKQHNSDLLWSIAGCHFSRMKGTIVAAPLSIEQLPEQMCTTTSRQRSPTPRANVHNYCATAIVGARGPVRAADGACSRPTCACASGRFLIPRPMAIEQLPAQMCTTTARQRSLGPEAPSAQFQAFTWLRACMFQSTSPCRASQSPPS